MNQHEYILAQIAEMDRQIQGAGDDPFMSSSLREKRGELVEELARTPAREKGKTILYFSGGPVWGSTGIDADFAARALGPFSEMIKTEYSARKYGPVADRGPRRGDPEAKVLLTGLPRGSFGLELSTPEAKDLFQGTIIAEAMRQSAKLVESAARSEEDFATTLAESPRRILANLQQFLTSIAEANASLHLVTADVDLHLRHPEIVAAKDRAMGAETVDDVARLPGVFRGAILNSWRFDFTLESGETITGRISSEVEEYVAWQMNRFTNQSCIGEFRVIRVTMRSGMVRTRYELMGLHKQDGDSDTLINREPTPPA